MTEDAQNWAEDVLAHLQTVRQDFAQAGVSRRHLKGYDHAMDDLMAEYLADFDTCPCVTDPTPETRQGIWVCAACGTPLNPPEPNDDATTNL